MRKLGILTTLALVLAVAGPLAAQDKQDKRDNKGGLGGVLDTLGSVLGTGPQKLHGIVVVTEGSTFVLRTDDQRTYRVDAAALDPQKKGALTPGQTVSVTARGGQAGVLTASDITPDAKSSGKAFATVSLAANQPATLYYEQGSRQEIVGVWIQPGTGQPAASQQNTPPPATAPPASAPSASVSSPQSVEGLVESIGVAELKLQTSDGRSVTVDTSGVDRQALRAIGPGDVVVVTGNGTSTPDRFVAKSVQPRR